MSRLFQLLQSKYPKDVAEIRAAVPMLCRFSDIEIEHMWEQFSGDFCASWLIVSQEGLDSFKEWLEE
jgi:hypothetical protein